MHCLYYGTEQGLRTLGEHDHDVRECLFDPYGQHELFQEEMHLYTRVKETIQLARRIKKEKKKVKSSLLIEGVRASEYSMSADESYVVVYNNTSKNIRMTSFDVPLDNCIYSNYEHKNSSSLRPFELLACRRSR